MLLLLLSRTAVCSNGRIYWEKTDGFFGPHSNLQKFSVCGAVRIEGEDVPVVVISSLHQVWAIEYGGVKRGKKCFDFADAGDGAEE